MSKPILENIAIIFGSLTAAIALLYLLQKAWCLILGKKSVYLSGWIGTPIHEVSHIIACIIFRHKVLEVSLFQPEPETGVLGYVSHSYDPSSIFQRVGCLFIGLAPLAGNLGVAFLLYKHAFIPIQNSGFSVYNIGIVYVMVCSILHAAPSPADLKGAAPGLVTLAVVLIPLMLIFPGVSQEVSDQLLMSIKATSFSLISLELP